MNKPEINKVQRNVEGKEYDMQEIIKEYAPTDDIMNRENERTQRLKEIIYSQLTPAERNVILLYTELDTIRRVAKELHVSPSTAWIEIKRIQKIIKDNLNKKL